jgi:hypothetical protein
MQRPASFTTFLRLFFLTKQAIPPRPKRKLSEALMCWLRRPIVYEHLEGGISGLHELSEPFLTRSVGAAHT